MDGIPIATLLAEIGLEVEPRGERAWTVRLPCAVRAPVAVTLVLRERSVVMRAFFVRGPDRDHQAVYARLLGKNLTTRDWRFGIDAHGDVHLVADAALAGLDADRLDGLLGALSVLVDETYEGVVRMGFEVPDGTDFGPPPA